MAKKKTKNLKSKIENPKSDDPFIKTSKEAGAYCGVTDRTIRRWAADGMTTTPEGYYIKAELDEWKAAGGRPGSGMLFDAKDRKEAADADFKGYKAKLAAIDLAIAEGKYIPKEEVEAGRIARIQAVKRALLGLGRRLAPQLAGMSEPRLVETTINECVRDIIAKFAGEDLATESTEITEKKN